jgi:hypothetical protein
MQVEDSGGPMSPDSTAKNEKKPASRLLPDEGEHVT